MKAQAIFLDCPAYLDKDGATRCGLPAEMEARYTIGSTDGPLDSAKIRCPRGHWFNGPIESLTVPQQRGVAAASAMHAATSAHAKPRHPSRGPETREKVMTPLV